MQRIKAFILLMLLIILSLSTVHGLQGTENYSRRPANENQVQQPFLATSSKGIIVCDSEIASNVGVEILKEGGNAIDAAVAVGFTLAVVYPQAGNIGGGGLMLIKLSNGEVTSVDYREKAPALATPKMFLDKAGNVKDDLSIKGALASGVPGTVAGFYSAWKSYGRIPWKRLVEPAIQLAEHGFKINKELADDIKENLNDFQTNHEAAHIFLTNSLDAPKQGYLLIQKDLANSLKLIANRGQDGFYKGPLAQLIASSIQAHGGIIQELDLQNYRPLDRQPITFTYRDYTIHSMSLPSSGGVLLYIILKTIETYDLKQLGNNSAEYVHLLTEVFKHAYAERSEHLGDPAFYYVPLTSLMSGEYINKLRSQINPESPTPSDKITPTRFATKENLNTTHFSIIDQQGNAVSNTYTLNGSFGSFFIPEKTGILMNNEMDDFAIKPGYPNQYGLLGSTANSIEPGKRMLSSMTPTIVEHDKKLFAVLGSPGGSRIITAVVQVLLNFIDFKMPIDKALVNPRFHHQWLPDTLLLENSFPESEVQKLLKKGYSIKKQNIGVVNAILFDEKLKTYHGMADPHRMGKAIGYE